MFSAGGAGRAPQKKTRALSINLNILSHSAALQYSQPLQPSQVCVSSPKPIFEVHLSKNELVAKDYRPKSIFLCTTFGFFSSDFFHVGLFVYVFICI